MDFESYLCFENYTDNMAASKAPTNTINVTSSSSTTATATTETATATTTIITTTNNIEHNFHELCRSCGKTNAELYDLFQTTNSPFNTSSTTCYTHLNNCSFISSNSNSNSSSSTTTNKPSTSTTFPAPGCTKSMVSLTFDSVAATAKATAKGQSNMDNILQEMQIWQLLIKCNDGLPQRICAKCTAQFYMIHKFRRKCLKVQTQLRALYEEQQKFYERQQQQKEKNVTVKDATIEATSTPTVPEAVTDADAVALDVDVDVAVAVAVSAEPQPAPLVEVVKPPVMHKVNDLVNDNYGEPQQAVVDNTNTKSSVSFEANTGNTNDFIAPRSTTATIIKTTTLLDNVETMPQKTEANEPTPTSSAPAFIDKTFEARIQQEHYTVTTGLKLMDEKKPLLKPSVLDSKRSPPLTLQQPLEQICDNDTTATATATATTTTDQANKSKKQCLDEEELLDTHIIFKSKSPQNESTQCHKNEELFETTDALTQENTFLNSSTSSTSSHVSTNTNDIFNLRIQQDCSGLNKANSENLFITKAALKAYTIPPSTSETENRDHQKPITNSEAIELKNANDNNNNAHINTIYSNRYDNRSELNDNTCSSTSNSNSTPSSCSSRKPKRTKNTGPKIIKYAHHNRRPGHCYKLNAKATVAATKMARTLQNYGSDSSGDCRWANAPKRKQRSKRLSKHKLKRLTPNETSSTSSLKAARKKRQQEKFKMCHKKSIQMEDEMSSAVSTTTTTTITKSLSTSPVSSAISSTSSSHLRATTPAVTDLVRKENMNKTSCSSADRLSSNNSCIMWKTKAAMKANANDMTVKVKNDDDPTANKPEISLPYKATATPTGSISSSVSSASTASSASSSSASLLMCGREADKSSKTLYENQSSNSSLKSNNNNLADEYCTHNKVTMSLAGNQVKDIEDQNEYVQNLLPEGADQKQIDANHHQANNERNIIDIVENNNTHTMQSINLDGNKEREYTQHAKNEKDEEEKQIISTPPVKFGGMKLIIQRKRGKRFKCRRKDEDEIPAANQVNTEATIPKRKRKSSHSRSLQSTLEMVPFPSLDDGYSKENKNSTSSDMATTSNEINENTKVPEFNSAEDENKENPISIMNNYEIDSDSNVSVYRDPLLLKNETIEEDTHMTDFTKIQLSIQNECTKEMYKLYKEKANLESPKKLIVRVPLTSLTQDFKRLHLTKDDQENEVEDETTNEDTPFNLNIQETNDETLCLEVANEPEYSGFEQESSLQKDISSSQSDLLGFSQNTDSSAGSIGSSLPSVDIVRYIEPPLCSASSKINDFINDFQNNCIDSSEIEESCDMIPTLVPRMTQELSDEIRDVDDTLNGIISEMHDKDMYTPQSGETDEFFAHSVYSPLTDAPTTPSQSFYAESPCTINSNPMSVSPFIHHNMDYNAMTPQSNHSSMGPGSCYMSGGGSTGPHSSIYSEHYPTYNECFEENTQSELIGFQNDVPCFENIEMTPSNNPNELPADINEEEETVITEDNNNTNSAKPSCVNDSVVDVEPMQDTAQFVAAQQPTEPLTDVPIIAPDLKPPQMPYNPANYQNLSTTPTFHMQTAANPLIPSTTTTQPHYIVTNTNQGPIIITNPQINPGRNQLQTPFKPHNNNLQFVTLGQAMKATNQTPANQLFNNNTNKINWPATVTTAPGFTQRPVLSTTNGGTTTYFINANGELYQANIHTPGLQNPSVNTIFVPPNPAQAFNKTRIENDNFMPTMQQQQHTPQHLSNGQSSQYIMLVNNLGGSPRYYATTPANLNPTVSPQQNISTPTVLIHPTTTAQNLQGSTTSYGKNSPSESNTETTKPSHVPITPALEQRTDSTPATSMHQKINQQLQKQIKERQLHLLQPRSPNVPQKITLVCRFCHKRPKFTNNVDYSNHIINLHPAEKPYNCPHCPTHFTRRSDRQMHVAQIHGARYQCAQCGLSFCAQRTLDFHLQKYHANLGRSHQHLQQNSSSTTAPATYQLLQHNQQQRLVRVEDVHVQVTGENKNKRSIDLTFDNSGGDGGADITASQSLNEVEMLSHTMGTQQQQQQQHQQQQPPQKSRKLGCPDCNGDNDDCCGSDKNHDQNDINSYTIQTAANNNSQNAGNESGNNHPQQHHQHVTIPSPEQTEPDSTTTLRHFRKRQLGEISTHFASASPSSSSSSSSSTFSLHNNNTGNNNGGNDNINLNHNSPDNVLAGDGGGEQIVVERTLRGSHNCLLCEESFTNEIALRKHHHLAHGAATQSTTCSSATTSMALVCTICKRGFRMRNALQRHMETHDAEGRPYECNICQVRFPRPSQLTLHKLTVHKFEKPNSCEECGKQFGTESAMKAHAVEHEEAARTTSASASEASTLSSSSSTQLQLSSRLYGDTITNTTSTNNEQNINLQSTTSGEDTSASALSNNNDTYNNTTIVSGLAT